jgi:WS/DGAT/MGAT family acyltransferase
VHEADTTLSLVLEVGSTDDRHLVERGFMQRMSGIDPMFIYSDTPETPMEVAYACVFDPGSAEGGYSFERIEGVLAERMPTLTPFRRRLMAVPLGLDHPRWVDDPEFDLANHLHRAALPEPGGEEEFTEMVAEVMGRPLQPDQPPWEMHVIEGLAGDMVGLIAKVHHSVIDGVAGAQLLAQLLDLTPDGRAVTETCPPWIPPRLPSHTELVTDALPSFVTSPLRALRAVREVGRTAVRLVRCVADEATGPVSIPLGAPTTFETPVGPRRAVAFAHLDLGEVRALKERFGATINDIVLAVCSGALRAHLAEHDCETESPLVAVIPVSVRGDEQTDSLGNRLSAMFVPLSNDRQTPLERLRTVAATSASCKGQERAVGYGTMASLLSDAIPPALARPLIQLGVRSGIMRRLRPGNLMISNVPGPDFPLYFAGMKLRALHPLGPVVDGVALNITVQSYQDSLFVGINACATAVPDLPGLARSMTEELTLLHKMAQGTSDRGTRHRRPPGPRPVAAHGGAGTSRHRGSAAALTT